MMKKRKKDIKIEELFNEHLEIVKKTLIHTRETFDEYICGENKKARDSSYKAHLEEGNADGKRREIIEKMHTGGYMPMVRKDLISFLAKQDKIADRAESTCDFLITQSPEIPGGYCEHINRILTLTLDALTPMNKSLRGFFNDFGLMREAVKEVNSIEEEIDTIEWDLTNKIFAGDLELDKKLHLSEMIFHVASISNVIEDAADLLDSVASKKKI